MKTHTKTYRKIQWLTVIIGLLLLLTDGFSDPLPSEYDIGLGEEDVRIRGAGAVDKLGSAVCAVGDLNGDGYRDLIVSAPRADGPVGVGAGQTYIFFGSQTFPDTIDLTQSDPDVIIYGMEENEWSGSSLASGDLNMDSFDDIVMGAPFSGLNHNGRVYILFGGAMFSPVWDLSVDSADVIITGGSMQDRLGEAVACGEINGDGYMDLVISAPYADIPFASDGGEVYTFWGSENWDSVIDLNSQSADMTIRAGAASDHLGIGLAVGDVNGDVFGDILVGAPQTDPYGRLDAGTAYLFEGWNSLPDTINLPQAFPDVTINGADNGDRLGEAVRFGDLNGDGYSDIVISAIHANSIGGPRAGQVYVIVGSVSLPTFIDMNTATPDILISGAATEDAVGSALALGDVNADGFDDLLIGAPFADVGSETEAGISYVVYGDSTLSPTVNLGAGEADITIYGNVDNDFVGDAVALSDIDSDGFLDIILGAPGVDPPGGESAGEAYVIFGNGDNPVFSHTKETPAGNLPNLRFPMQNAWVDFANGGSGIVTVSRTPNYPPHTSPPARVWWEITTTKNFATIIQVTFRYTAEQISHLNENVLTLWWRDQLEDPFFQVAGASVMPSSNRITAPVSVLGQFTISDIMHPLGVPLDENTQNIVTDYRLFPAFPNPFNSQVAISYHIAALGHVSLSVWNVLGQQVAIIVDDTQSPDHYSVTWDAGFHPSGLYFTVLEINGFEAVEKILLLK